MLEMLGVLGIMAILMLGGIWGYQRAINSSKAQSTAQMIRNMVFEQQHQMRNINKNVSGPYSQLRLNANISGKYAHYFQIETDISDEGFCDALKRSELIQADLVMVNNDINGVCPGNIKFYFKKNTSIVENLTYKDETGQTQFCPEGYIECDNEGIANACQEVYYLN